MDAEWWAGLCPNRNLTRFSPKTGARFLGYATIPGEPGASPSPRKAGGDQNLRPAGKDRSHSFARPARRYRGTRTRGAIARARGSKNPPCNYDRSQQGRKYFKLRHCQLAPAGLRSAFRSLVTMRPARRHHRLQGTSGTLWSPGHPTPRTPPQRLPAASAALPAGPPPQHFQPGRRRVDDASSRPQPFGL
jgi:hypothetical protein